MGGIGEFILFGGIGGEGLASKEEGDVHGQSHCGKTGWLSGDAGRPGIGRRTTLGTVRETKPGARSPEVRPSHSLQQCV